MKSNNLSQQILFLFDVLFTSKPATLMKTESTFLLVDIEYRKIYLCKTRIFFFGLSSQIKYNFEKIA